MARQFEPDQATRRWPRVRFRLRTLLLLPVVVAALLLVAFPKLITGDFVKFRVASIDESHGSVTIEMDARVSSGTGWGATNELNGGGLGVSGRSQSHWTHFIPTWPRHKTIIVNIRFNIDRLPPDTDILGDVLVIQRGTSYHVTPGQRFDLARTQNVDGERGSCWFEVSRGSRLGL